MIELSVAMEDEQETYDLEGRLVNAAPYFIDHPLNRDANGGKKYFQDEATNSRVEVNTEPHSSADSFVREYLKIEDKRRIICEERRVITVPTSEMGAGVSELNLKPEVLERLFGYMVIFGMEAVHKLVKDSGVHFHIDTPEDDIGKINQFNGLLALRSTIALTSTSSISPERKNSLNNHRYNNLSDPDEGALSTIPEDRSYIVSLQNLVERDIKRQRAWKRDFDANIWRYAKEVPLDYNFLKAFPIEKTGYSDARDRPSIGNGTRELRIHGASPADVKVGYFAFLLGYANMLLQEKNLILPATEDGVYSFRKGKVIFPNEQTNTLSTQAAVKEGLEDSFVKEYNMALLQYGEQGLPESERHYLDPLKDMVKSGKNIASQLLDYLGRKHIYTPQESAQAVLFQHRRNQQGLESLREKIGYRG